MNILRRIRLVIGVGALLILGAFMLGTWLFGEVAVYVVVPEDRAIELSANGQVLAPKVSGHQRFALKQGDYSFAMKDATSGKVQTYALKLHNGFDEYVLPIDGQQCFMRVDMTRTMYSRRNASAGASAAPTVIDRIAAHEPFTRKKHDYFDTNEMPSSIKERDQVNLLTQLDCDELKQNDAALLSELGF